MQFLQLQHLEFFGNYFFHQTLLNYVLDCLKFGCKEWIPCIRYWEYWSMGKEGFNGLKNSIRDGWGYQNGWIFGEVPNGSWPPPPTSQNGPYLWKSCACISYYLALVPPSIYSTISIIYKILWFYNFLKMTGGAVKGRLEFFHKFIRFGSGILPLDGTGGIWIILDTCHLFCATQLLSILKHY